MKRTLVQIYEVQTPQEAEALVALGVDHIGSVILSRTAWRQPVIKETVRVIQRLGARSGLIPLFDDPETVSCLLAYYQPDFVHFCEALSPFSGHADAAVRTCDALVALQRVVKERFPGVAVMRSLSVPQAGLAGDDGMLDRILAYARTLAAQSDYFLIDTLRGDQGGLHDQPVTGFVGITGEPCDWEMAAAIVAASPVPVILAGGISDGNVFDAVVKVRPAGVDSCTKTNTVDDQGVPVRFRKDLRKVKRMVDEVRRVDRSLEERRAS